MTGKCKDKETCNSRRALTPAMLERDKGKHYNKPINE